LNKETIGPITANSIPSALLTLGKYGISYVYVL